MKGESVMIITCPKCGTVIEERYTAISIIGMSGTLKGYCKECCQTIELPINSKEVEKIREEFVPEPTVKYDD